MSKSDLADFFLLVRARLCLVLDRKVPVPVGGSQWTGKVPKR